MISAALCTVATTAFGSGFSIFEQGAKATAMGGAFAATADDPSAIFYNPAGIAQQRQLSVLAGGTGINFANEFTGDPNDPFTSGVTAEYRHHTFLLPNTYAVVPIGTNLSFGLGIFAPFGLRTNWAEPYPGRFISRDANIKTLSVAPTLAWQSGDGRWAFGGGAEYRRAHVVLQRNNGALNPFTGRISDVANIYLNSDWESAWGYNVGMLLKPNATWRIGASYRSGMTIDFNGDATFTQIPTGNAQFDAIVKAQLPPNQTISTSIPFPSTAVLGVATTMFHNWDVEADITRTHWSSFKTLNVTFNTTPANNLVRPQNWHDTSSYRIGGNRRVTDAWDVRLGGVYDENPQPTEGVGPLLPDSDRIGIMFGVGWHRGPFMLDLSEMVLHFKERSTMGRSNDNFNGTYKTDANLISVNVGYRF